MKNVLMVTKSFVPEQSVSSFRASRIAQELDMHDWNPSVITLSKEETEEVQSLHVEHQEIFLNRVPVSKDAGLRWIPVLLTRMMKVIKRQNIDLVYITGPPFLIFITAPVIKFLTGVPYVLDLRDPWSLGLDERDDSVLEKGFCLLTLILEPLTFHHADQIILNSKAMMEQYREQYQNSICDVPEGKLDAIPNGYEEDDLTKGIDKQREIETFQLIYPGKFRNSMKDFFKGFRLLSSEVPECEFIHYGDVDGQYTDEVRANVKQLDLEKQVDFRGYVKREIVLNGLDRANVGIAVTRETDPTHIPMKIFDYIARNLPILVVDDSEGAAAQLVSQFKNGYVVPHGKPSEVYGTLLRIYQNGEIELDDCDLRSTYSMSNRTSEIAGVFNEAIR